MVNSPELVLLSRCSWGDPTQAEWNAFHAMGDVNLDGYINQTDLDLIGAKYLWAGPPGSIPEDINADGVVDMMDVTICSYNQGWDICAYFGRRSTQLTLALISEEVKPDVPFTVGGQLTALDNGEPVAGAEIVLRRRIDPETYWVEMGRTTTGSNGQYSFGDTLPIGVAAHYVSVFEGNATFMGCE